MGTEDRINKAKEAAKRAAAGNFGTQSFNAQQQGALTMLQNQGMSRDDAQKQLSKEDLWMTDKYQGMSKDDAQLLREDWMKTQQAQYKQAELDALRGTLAPDVPRVNAPAVPMTPQGPAAPTGTAPSGGLSPPAPMTGAPVGPTQPMTPPQQGDNYQAQVPNMNDQVMAAPDPVRDTGYSRWSQKTPQLATQAEAAPMVTYDTSHLNRATPRQSAGDLYRGSTDTSRALRSDIMSKYGGGQNG